MDKPAFKANIIDDGLGILPCMSGKPGFYSVPSYRKYCIDASGNLHHCFRSDQLLKPLETPRSDKRTDLGVYKRFILTNDITGLKHNVARHRMVITAHKGFPDDPAKITVNHINGIPGDDRVENLEWQTQYENNIHAIKNGLRNLVGIERWHVESGEKTQYPSVPEFVRQTGMAKGTILKRLATDNGQVYRDGYRYRYLRDEWSDTPQSYFEQKLNTTGKPILAWDARDQKVHEFESGYHAARHYGIKQKDWVNTIARGHHTIPSYGCFFRTKKEHPPLWPKLTDDQLRALKLQGYPPVFEPWVILDDCETGKEVYIGSYKGAQELISKAVGSIRNAGNKGKTIGKYKPRLIYKDAFYND